jgi:hypothetical protein
MTAPGNSVVIFALLALFLACAGYAAGRMHERYQTDRDREEAYREGYETATRSVFSLAARVIAPRRAVRASAPVKTPADDATTTALPGPASMPLGSDGPATSAAAPLSTHGHPASSYPPLGLPVPSSPAGPPPAAPPAARTPAASSAADVSVPDLGFPAPAPPPPRTVAEPAALGGVTYQPFPDPRPADVRAGVAGEPSSGRHTVPDELVQASTYRLPPDRVFRAKVKDTTKPPATPRDPAAGVSVPKPRQS